MGRNSKTSRTAGSRNGGSFFIMATSSREPHGSGMFSPAGCSASKKPICSEG
jgi:hypothetical protein